MSESRRVPSAPFTRVNSTAAASSTGKPRAAVDVVASADEASTGHGDPHGVGHVASLVAEGPVAGPTEVGPATGVCVCQSEARMRSYSSRGTTGASSRPRSSMCTRWVSRADQAAAAAMIPMPNVMLPTMSGTFDPPGATIA